MKFLLILPVVFSVEVFAVTLGEIGAAAGIANTLQGTAQPSHKKTLDQVKQKMNQHEEDQKNREALARSIIDPSSLEAEIAGNPPPEQAPPFPGTAPPNHHSFSEEPPAGDLTEEEVNKRFSAGDEVIYQEVEPVDYKSSMQVFYKKNRCPANSGTNCKRGAVLTNIKSVIFDYAHARGNFAPKSESAK